MSIELKRVSYLVSTRNRASYLADAFSNLREFVTPEDEVVVVDGASTDDTAKVVEANKDLISHYISEPDLGEAHGYNKGILAARGRYFKFVTDDDYIFPDGMRAAIALMERSPEAEAILCGGESFTFDPVTREKHFRQFIHLPAGRIQSDGVENIFEHVTCGVGLIFTRRAIARAGLLDTSFVAVDAEYMARFLSSGVSFFYAGIRLFRHIAYPHSNQRRGEIILRDAQRILMRARRPDLVEKYYGIADLTELLKTAGMPVSDAQSRWIGCGEKLRLTGCNLKLLSAVLEAGTCFKGWVRRKLAHPLRTFLGPAESIVPTNVTRPQKDIHWDGNLHRLLPASGS